jgi:SAM-dependent methyltransferase
MARLCREYRTRVHVVLPPVTVAGHDRDAIVVHLDEAEWRGIPLTGPGTASGNIRLLAADASALPFPEASLSAVVTQYVMDIVGNPSAVAAQVQRVLKPGGIWIDFSIPFYTPGDPPSLGARPLAELPAWLKPLGFAPVELSRHRFILLNLEKVYEGGDRYDQEAHFIIAKKLESLERTRGAIRATVRGAHDPSGWARVPGLVRGREVRLVTRKAFGPEGVEERLEVEVDSEAFPVQAEYAALVEALFTLIDGCRNLGDIFSELAALGFDLHEDEFFELTDYLVYRHGVIRWRDDDLAVVWRTGP